MYTLVIMDDFTRFTRVPFCATKDDALNLFLNFAFRKKNKEEEIANPKETHHDILRETRITKDHPKDQVIKDVQIGLMTHFSHHNAC